MLDTNTVSGLIREQPNVVRRVISVPMASLCISAVTAGELHYCLAKRPEAKRLQALVWEFLLRVDVLPWDAGIAEHYGAVRAEIARCGKPLAPLDMLIAAHALGSNAVLVTNDRTFAEVPALRIEDWTAA